ncbi:hypothetical protein B0H13DRAFT_1889966 [Mycena leptocephala]|nr:hypothetical protein B0H13DRAFT_1889966 [Mycena leptocephala]
MILASDPTLVPENHFDSILRDLASGALRMMQQLIRGEVDRRLYGGGIIKGLWGLLLRSCPPSHALLQDLFQIQPEFLEDTLSSSPDDLHNIVQWLKSFPRPQAELIARFEIHSEMENQQPWNFGKYTFGYFEEQWQEWQEWRANNLALSG